MTPSVNKKTDSGDMDTDGFSVTILEEPTVNTGEGRDVIAITIYRSSRPEGLGKSLGSYVRLGMQIPYNLAVCRPRKHD